MTLTVYLEIQQGFAVIKILVRAYKYSSLWTIVLTENKTDS